MFAIVRERKAVAALEALASSTPSAVSDASPVERAAALVLCNLLLIICSKDWGRAVLEAPGRIDRRIAADAVLLMAERRSVLAASATQLDGRRADDPSVSAFRWEMLANEIVTLTLGSGLSPAAGKAMAACWKSLWTSRRACDDAVRAMARYAKAYTVEPTPRIDGKRPSEEYLRRLGGTLPPMFRPKAGKGAAKPAPGRGAPTKSAPARAGTGKGKAGR